MTDINVLCTQINECFADWIDGAKVITYPRPLDAKANEIPKATPKDCDNAELTVSVKPEHLLEFCYALRDQAHLDFKMLVDLCGVDYLHYGLDDWQTETTTETGFSRGVTRDRIRDNPVKPNRFAVIYHLLSLTHNRRIRLCVNLQNEKSLVVDSVTAVWPSANWFEREAFDLFGILFKGHPDLRRLLTDYGFVGHPFRKDFPLIGKVEARYDAKQQRVIYEPVSIQMRVLEPKVIRHDNRYLVPSEDQK